jgi:DNA primase
MSYQQDDILDKLEDLGIKNITIKNENLRGTCPWHGGDNSSALSINLATGYIHCFACGFKDNLASVLNLSDKDIEKFVGIDIKSQQKEIVDLSEFAELIVEEMNIDYSHPYLKTRCYDSTLLEYVGVGVSTSGIYKNRIIFPYRDCENKLHGFKSRTFNKVFFIDNYYNLMSMFFLEQFWVKDRPIILVEGEWDALRLVELGFTNVFALGGCELTNDRIENLKSKTNELFLALDMDNAGRAAVENIKNKISADIELYNIIYNYKDPGMIKYKIEFTQALNKKERLFNE